MPQTLAAIRIVIRPQERCKVLSNSAPLRVTTESQWTVFFSTMAARRFPPPWSVDDPDVRLGRPIVCDADGHALAYVYFEDEIGGALSRYAKVTSDSIPLSAGEPHDI